MPGIEMIDSRYRDFKFDLKSVVADNTSAARFVVGGQPMSVNDCDLRTVGIVLAFAGTNSGIDWFANLTNGIAYDRTSATFLLTGKRWPESYEVRLVPASPPVHSACWSGTPPRLSGRCSKGRGRLIPSVS